MQLFFENGKTQGTFGREDRQAALPQAASYIAQAEGDGLEYEFPAGALAPFLWLTTDMLLEGNHLVVFILKLREGLGGPVFSFSFGLLNQCQARVRIPLTAANQNRWMYPREAAWLKPLCWGERVDLSRVDYLTFEVYRKSDQPVRFSMTPLIATDVEPDRLAAPLLPSGPLLDQLGQSTLHQWAGKSVSPQQVTDRLKLQLAQAPNQHWPDHFSRWGGWKERHLPASGFFHTRQDGGRWWLVDPDGHPFWSAGLDCVTPDTAANYEGLANALAWLPDRTGEFTAAFENRPAEMVNYLKANFIRAFGADGWYAAWSEITLAELHRLGFNTVANWSDWRTAARAGIPYTRPLENTYATLPQIYRDFPDVFHPDFPEACTQYAEQLRETRDDPALIGYFLMNEPTWGFAQLTPAEGMLVNTPDCYSRLALVDWLRVRYADDAALANAWGMPVSLINLAEENWNQPFSEQARADLAEFSAILVERFFGGLSEACRAADPNHLNLGIRYYTVPPAWALAGMRRFDVFSMNCYRQRLPADDMEKIAAMLEMPILIGEWHFGALDAGLPASGIGRVANQAARGQAYRVYIVDVCNRPYEELCTAARLSHENLYAVAAAQAQPYADTPRYLPMLYL
jgi:hypothetical protein